MDAKTMDFSNCPIVALQRAACRGKCLVAQKLPVAVSEAVNRGELFFLRRRGFPQGYILRKTDAWGIVARRVPGGE